MSDAWSKQRRLSMLPMGLNTNLPPMKTRFQVAIAVLPLGLMFAAFVPLIFFASWLESALGIPHDSSIRASANGTLWISVFLFVMVVLMITGYVAGWLVNAVISRWVFGWPAQKVVAVFLRSEIPQDWLRSLPANSSGHAAVLASNSKWERQRAGGPVRFILNRGVLSWGTAMFVAMYLYPTLAHGRSVQAASLLLNLAIWAVGGALFGGLLWLFGEWSYKKSTSQDVGR
jgi:hypothetical protein